MTTRFLLNGKKPLDEIILVGIPNLDLGATAAKSHFVRLADIGIHCSAGQLCSPSLEFEGYGTQARHENSKGCAI